MQKHYNHKNRRKYNLKAHIVLVTKYRKTLLQYGLDDFVKRAIIYLAGQNNWTVIAMETDKDHIHILLEYDTTERVCDIISILKRQTTYYLWNRYGTYLSRQYWKKHSFRAAGYFAFSIGEVTAATIENYIYEQC